MLPHFFYATGKPVGKTVQEVFDVTRRSEAKALRAQSVKSLVCPGAVSLQTFSHHHSLSGALQKAGMLRAAGEKPKRTLTAEMFTTQRHDERFTTAERSKLSSLQQKTEGKQSQTTEPQLMSSSRKHLHRSHLHSSHTEDIMQVCCRTVK